MNENLKTIREKDEVEQLADLNQFFSEAFTHNMTYKEQALKARNFYDGYQWGEKELEVLRRRKQPAVVFNRIKPIVNTIISLQKGNRAEISFKPYDVSDHDFAIAQIYNSIGKHDNKIAKYAFYESKAFKDYVITGRGAIQAYYDNDKKRLAYDYIDFRDLYVDPSSKMDSMDDADYVHVATYIDEIDLKLQFGIDANDVIGSDMGLMESELPAVEAGVQNKVRLVQSWIRVPVRDEQTGEYRNEYDCFIWVDGKILKYYQNPYPSMGRFPVVQMTLYRDLDNNPYGMVRDLIDPQRVLNHARSKASHILNTNKFVYREGSFDGTQQELAEALSKPDSLIPLEMGKDDIADITPKADIQALMAMMEQAQAQIPDISGVGEEVSAQADKALSGRAIALRQQSGLTRMTEVFDGLQRFREGVGRCMLGIIRDYYDVERVARLVTRGGDEEAAQVDVSQVIDILRSDTVVEFDIITGTDPVTLTQQSEAYQNLLQIFALNPQAIPVQALVQFSNMSNKHEILELMNQADQEKQALAQLQQMAQQQQETIEMLQKKLEEKDQTILKLLEKAQVAVANSV